MAANYTYSTYNLTRENVESDCPFLVHEIADSEKEELESKGLAFTNETEALRAAKRAYWRQQAEKLSRPWQSVDDWCVAYNDRTETMVIRQVNFGVETPYCFDTEEDAVRALTAIGEENWLRFVLGVGGVWLKKRVFVP